MELKDKKLFLLDMDGTLYLGDDLFPETLPFLEQVKKNGARYLFLTNNSSKSVSAYVEKLALLGVPATFEDFLTSTQATVVYMKKEHPNARIYALGTRSFVEELRGAGLSVTTDLEDAVDVFLMGFDTELCFKKLEDASKLLLRDIPYIATNPDLVCPTSYGSVPDCGSVAIMLKNATGRTPRYIGKPHPEMILLAMEKCGVSKDETCMVGDRVYTDIASGYNAGVDTVFVLSGEGTVKDARESETPPTYIMQNVGELHKRIQR